MMKKLIEGLIRLLIYIFLPETHLHKNPLKKPKSLESQYKLDRFKELVDSGKKD